MTKFKDFELGQGEAVEGEEFGFGLKVRHMVQKMVQLTSSDLILVGWIHKFLAEIHKQR